MAGNVKIATYLQVPFYPFSGELTVLCMALVGAGLGFLWFNCHPAKVFMGDTGSLAIGGVLGVIAICCKQELLLLVVGGVFVIEALSVILQVVQLQAARQARSSSCRRSIIISNSRAGRRTPSSSAFGSSRSCSRPSGLATLKLQMTNSRCKQNKRIAVLGAGESGGGGHAAPGGGRTW